MDKKISSILFNGNISDLFNLNEDTFLDVFDGVPQFNLNRKELEKEIHPLLRRSEVKVNIMLK